MQQTSLRQELVHPHEISLFLRSSSYWPASSSINNSLWIRLLKADKLLNLRNEGLLSMLGSAVRKEFIVIEKRGQNRRMLTMFSGWTAVSFFMQLRKHHLCLLHNLALLSWQSLISFCPVSWFQMASPPSPLIPLWSFWPLPSFISFLIFFVEGRSVAVLQEDAKEDFVFGRILHFPLLDFDLKLPLYTPTDHSGFWCESLLSFLNVSQCLSMCSL